MNSTNENTRTFTVTPNPFVGHQINQAARAIFATVGSIMIVCGVIGNGLLIAVISRRFRQKRYLHDLFIINLALADMLTLGYWLSYFVLDLILGYYPVVNQKHCQANGVVIGVLLVTSVTTLLSISLNRYLHVCHSHLYTRTFTLPRTLFICLFSWFLGLTLTLPPVFEIGAGSYHYNHFTHICSFNRHKLNYSKITVLLFASVPMFFIGYWNFAIFRFWKKARMRLSSRFHLVCKDKTDEKHSPKRERLAKSPDPDADGDQEREDDMKNEKKEKDDMKNVPCDSHDSQINIGILSESSDTNQSHTDITSFQNSQQDDSVAYPDSDSHDNVMEDDIKTDTVDCENSVRQFCSVEQSGQTWNSKDEIDEVCIRDEIDEVCIRDEIDEVCIKDEIDEVCIKDENKTTEPANLSECLKTGMSKRAGKSEGKCPKLPANDQQDVPATSLIPASLKTAVLRSQTVLFQKAHTLSSRRTKHHITTAMETVQRQRKKHKAREVAFVRSLFVVFILMFVSFIPYGVTIIISSYVDIPSEVAILGIMLLFVNSAINWIVYGVMNPVFRKGYIQCVRQMLTTCCCVGQEVADKYLNASQNSLLTASTHKFHTDNECDQSVVSQTTSGVV